MTPEALNRMKALLDRYTLARECYSQALRGGTRGQVEIFGGVGQPKMVLDDEILLDALIEQVVKLHNACKDAGIDMSGWPPPDRS